MALNTESKGLDLVRLIERHQAGLWRYLRVLGCDAWLADELTQETFLAVLRKPFDDYNSAASAKYLRRVAYNLLLCAQRRRRRVTTVEDIEQIDTSWRQWQGDGPDDDLLDALRASLEELPSRSRWVLEMRYRDRFSRSQIATALGISEDGAKNALQRAKKKLRQCIERRMV